MMHIKLCDLKANYIANKKAIDEAIERVIGNSSYILGAEVEGFENNFAAYCRAKHCIGVSNATDGIYLALKAMEIKGDVIIPSMNYVADIEAIINAGCNPVLCDVDKNGCIDVNNIIRSLTERTRAVIVVHLYGQSCDIGKICELQSKIKIKIIEDCSHEHGAIYNNSYLGTFGDVGVFSFFPSKILGCFGDGGCIITNNTYLANRLHSMRNHGRIDKYTHEYVGGNYRLDAIQAAILNAKLNILDKCVTARKKLADRYKKMLSNKYKIIGNDDCVYYVFPVLCNNRDKLMKYLNDNGINAIIHYPIPIHKQPAYKNDRYLENAEYIANNVLSLPIYPEMTHTQQDYIIKKVNSFDNN